MNRQLSPLTLLLGNLFTVGVTLALYQQLALSPWTILIPLILLALIYTALNMGEQLQGDGNWSRLPRSELPRLLPRALARYLVWLALIGSAWLFYHLVPYYLDELFSPLRQLLTVVLYCYLWLGLPYFLLTLGLRHSRREDYYDPAVRLLLIFRTLARSVESGQGLTLVRKLFRRRYNLKVVLNLAMRVYFIPALVIQVLPNSSYLLRIMDDWSWSQSLLTWLFFITGLLWLMDIFNATTSYLVESRWLENRSRSIDLTIGGWLVCTMCYVPLNQVTGTMFPFAPNQISYQSADLLMADNTGLLIMKLLEVILLGAHVLCNLSLGPSVANITLKKLQDRGVYGLVRHPGTTTKLLLWLVTSGLYRVFWQWRFIAGFAAWTLIYVLRALTEERHLKKFPQYREYMKRVKYRFLPWLF